MKIICIRDFGDKTTGKTYSEQVKRKVGDILDCDDALANERIRKGFAKEYIEDTVEDVVEEPIIEVKEKKSRKK